MGLLVSNKRFRLFWIGSLFDDMSLPISMMAIAWLLLSLTDSALWVGIGAAMHGVGMTAFSLLAGALIDRHNRLRILLLAQCIQMMVTLIVGTMVLMENEYLPVILFLALMNGLVHAVKISGKMALTLDIVGQESLLKGIAANFFSMTTMSVVGPLLAGWIIEPYGIEYSFFLTSLAVLLAILVLINLRGIETPKPTESSHKEDIVEGAKYVLRTPLIRLVIVTIMVSELFGWAVESMLPVIARDELGLGATGLGYLIAGGAGGAALSSVIISLAPEVKRKYLMVVLGLVSFGVGLIAFALSNSFYVSLAIIALAYGGATMYESALATILQSSVPDGIRGRVLSFQSFSWGLSGIAGIHSGAIATVLGAPIAVGFGGFIIITHAVRITRKLKMLLAVSDSNN